MKDYSIYNNNKNKISLVIKNLLEHNNKQINHKFINTTILKKRLLKINNNGHVPD
jgi:hypothetical protein